MRLTIPEGIYTMPVKRSIIKSKHLKYHKASRALKFAIHDNVSQTTYFNCNYLTTLLNKICKNLLYHKVKFFVGYNDNQSK